MTVIRIDRRMGAPADPFLWCSNGDKIVSDASGNFDNRD